MTAAETLLAAPRAALLDTLRAGHTPDPDALADQMYVGISLGMPGWVDRLAWKTFLKTFHRDPHSGQLRGWNVRLHQDGIGAPPRKMQRRGQPLSFGHYRVRDLAPDEAPRGLKSGLLLDYGAGGNPAWDAVGLVRDPLVSLDPDDPSVLLGWTYLTLLGQTVPTPSFFLLQHAGSLDHIAEPSGR